MTVQLLDQKLGVVDRVATGQRVIFHLRYNARTRELLGSGMKLRPPPPSQVQRAHARAARVGD